MPFRTPIPHSPRPATAPGPRSREAQAPARGRETPPARQLRALNGEPVTPVGPTANIPKPRLMTQVMANRPAKPDVLVHGIIHRSAKTVIIGGSKAFKTWSFLHLACALAVGGEWWGFQCEQGDVLYINFEIHDGFFADRFEAVVEAMGVDIRQVSEHFYYMGLRGKATDLSKLADLISEAARTHRYRMIIIDPAYKCIGDRDENSAGDMADFMNVLDRISAETDAAILVGHHFSKGNQAAKDMIDRASGSGTWGRDPDTIITMTPLEEEDTFAVEFRLRNFAPQESFAVKRVHPLMIKDNEVDATELRQPATSRRGREPVYGDAEFLECLQDGMHFQEWKDACMATGIRASTFSRRVREMVSENIVRKTQNGYFRVPTEQR